jgi:flagella basal body P-ring formation protein FlgA
MASHRRMHVRTFTTPLLRAAFAAAGLALSAVPALAETFISLNRTAEVRAGAPVTLAQVATVTGDDAATIGKLVILETPGRETTELDTEQLRAALSKHKVNWAATSIRGSRLKLTVTSGDEANASAAGTLAGASGGAVNAAISLQSPDAAAASAAGGYSSGPTLRDLVAERLAVIHGVELDGIRIDYDTTPAVKYLDLPIGDVTDSSVVPQAAPGTTRMPLRVELRRRDGSVDFRVLAARIELRKIVTVAAAPIDRGEMITEDLVRVETRWVSPAGDAPLSMERVIGASAKRRIETGRLVTRGDVQPPIVVQRGDTVWVLVRSGTFEIKTKAKAMSQARDGESVTMQAEGSKRTFVARMEGRLAVAELNTDHTDRAPGQIPAPTVEVAGRGANK